MFSDAAECAGQNEKTLQFCDPELESAAVIEVFLTMATDGEFFPDPDRGPYGENLTDEEDCKRQLKVLHFLQKYDCCILIRLFEMSLYDQLQYNFMRPIPIFFLGAVLENYKLCSAALQKMCRGDFKERTKAAPLRVCPADPGNISDEVWNLLPQKYARAWVVAWARGEGAHGHLTDPGLHSLERVVWHFDDLLVV